MYRFQGGSGRRSRRRLAPALLGVVAATTLVAAACGGNDDDDAVAATRPAAGPTTTDAATEPTAAPAETTAATETRIAGGSAAAVSVSAADAEAITGAFCDAYMDVNMAAAAFGDPDADPVALASALVEPAKKAASLAPPDLADELGSAVASLEQAVATKDPSLVEQADPTKTNEWTAANCGWPEVKATAEDFHFVGIPDSLKAGDYTFQLTNEGKEFHVLVIVARKPGVTESWDQLLADPAAESKTMTLTGVAAPPGAPASGSVRLDPGEYMVLCPIPLGSVGETPGSGPPHFTAGMHQVLTVTA